jgi:D-glycero-D-manno-heptose 1,7-bisphosphate phosphatase
VNQSRLPHAVFLDRDGTINVKAPEGRYVTSVSEFELIDGAREAIRTLNKLSIPAIVVTNQRGIALGVMTEEQLAAVHRHMEVELADGGARIDAIYHCPHDRGLCACRKPEVGLFVQAQRDFPGIELTHCAVVGDSATDVEVGMRIGATTVLIRADHQIDCDTKGEQLHADHYVGSLAEAVMWLTT